MSMYGRQPTLEESAAATILTGVRRMLDFCLPEFASQTVGVGGGGRVVHVETVAVIECFILYSFVTAVSCGF